MNGQTLSASSTAVTDFLAKMIEVHARRLIPQVNLLKSVGFLDNSVLIGNNSPTPSKSCGKTVSSHNNVTISARKRRRDEILQILMIMRMRMMMILKSEELIQI